MLYKIFKLYLNKLDPELAHSLAIKSIKSSFLFPAFFLKKKNKNLQHRVFGINFENPVGLAAGFDKNAEIYNHIQKLGFGFSEVGTITPQAQLGNIKPRLFRLEEDEGIINRLGFPNDGMKVIKKRIQEDMPKGILGINIGPNKENAMLVDDFLLCFDNFFNIASYFAINISSPNTPNLRLQHEEKKILKLIEFIQIRREEKKSNVPILFKISPDINDFEIKKLSYIFLKKKIDGLILTNTTIENKKNLLSEHKSEEGGLSGAPLYDISNKIIQKFYIHLKNTVPIIGVGGVCDGKTAFEKIKSGAALLQIYTSLIYKGPYIANKINSELSYLIKKNGYKNISEIIGINCKL